MNFISKIREPKRGPAKFFAGFTLFELVVTMTVLSIFVLGTVPLVTNAVRRQKEERLRDSLRMIRLAIDEFKRDTVGACPLGSVTTVNPAGRGTFNIPSDPRSRVVIDDCTIFDTENLDRFPPTLDVLVDGIAVRPRGLNIMLAYGFGRVVINVLVGKFIADRFFSGHKTSESITILTGVILNVALLSLPYIWPLALFLFFAIGTGLVVTSRSSSSWKVS